ncbi:MAG TPA: Smr/MutS family protein [Stellaceae bacterium]|nr:Smr/MutS family protein [Stellaceae bacterium]
MWRAAMRGVAPLEAADAPLPPSPEPAPRRARAPLVVAVPPDDLAADAAPGLDRRSAERLRRGQRAIEARLDLHGMTQDQAHRALDRFIARAQDGGKRCLLVITGKSGVLRETVPRWLNEAPNRGRLLAFSPAQPRDGGPGALYLLLRRRR